MPLVFDTLFDRQRDLHPPAVGFFAFVKNYFLLVVADAHPVFDVIFFPFKREVAGTSVIPVDEIPDHLGHQVGGLAALVEPGINLIIPDGGQFIA